MKNTIAFLDSQGCPSGSQGIQRRSPGLSLCFLFFFFFLFFLFVFFVFFFFFFFFCLFFVFFFFFFFSFFFFFFSSNVSWGWTQFTVKVGVLNAGNVGW